MDLPPRTVKTPEQSSEDTKSKNALQKAVKEPIVTMEQERAKKLQKNLANTIFMSKNEKIMPKSFKMQTKYHQNLTLDIGFVLGCWIPS